jgi:hypothetical protein
VAIIGDSRKLRRVLGRAPEIKFEALLRIVLAHDLAQLGCRIPFDVPQTGTSV